MLKAERTGILKSMVKRNVFGMILALIFLTSCSLEQEALPTLRALEFPDLRLTNATYVLGRSSETPLTVQAQTIAIYQKTNQAELEQIVFEQLDKEGKPLLSGRADHAQVNTNTYDAELSGNIVVHKTDEGFTVEAETLTWLHEKQILKSETEGPVKVIFDETNTIEGKGFFGDLQKGTYEFSLLHQGVIHL